MPNQVSSSCSMVTDFLDSLNPGKTVTSPERVQGRYEQSERRRLQSHCPYQGSGSVLWISASHFFLFAFGLLPDPWSGHFFYYSSQFCTCWGECNFYLFMPPYQNLHLWILNIDFKYFLWVYLIIGVGFLIYSSDSARGQFSSVQSLSHIQLFATPWITAHQASLSIINSWSSPKLMCIESVMPSSHLILCCPLFLLPPIPPSTRVFSYESAVHMRWPKYWSFSFNISPSNEYPGLISFRIDWLDLLAVQGTLISLLQHHS